MAELFDGLIGNADDIEVDDRASVLAGDDLDDASEERLRWISSNDDGAWPDSVGLIGLVEERLEQVTARTLEPGPSKGRRIEL